jgi:ABC-type Fe3+-siderophore transport system permease subunit
LKILVKILSYIVFIGLFFGIFSKELLGDRLGDVIIGASVLVGTFIFMPLFLAHRWKGKKLKDYTLSDENLKKMKENSGKY